MLALPRKKSRRENGGSRAKRRALLRRTASLLVSALPAIEETRSGPFEEHLKAIPDGMLL